MPPDPVSIDTRLSQLQIAARDSQHPPAGRRGGGEPPSGIEPRIARLEASVAHIERDIDGIRGDIREVRVDIKELRKTHETDFRLLFAALIAVALGLAGLMAKGFHWL